MLSKAHLTSHSRMFGSRSSKEEAPSEVELKRCPTSALSTEPLPWDSRERLARELSIAKCRVQVWFQNQRRKRLKQSQLPSENVSQNGEGAPRCTPRPPSPPLCPQSCSQEYSAREASRKRTVISPSRTSILVQAFKRDCFPGIVTREKLAHQTGIPELGGPSGGLWAAFGFAGTPHFPGPRDSFAENGPAELTLDLTNQRTGSQVGC
ncbi:double homeobox protein 4C isoform X3 [Bubalus bubalis]|uniref:double homeobox protein 4C isoform X3 n=1 Tax=Bubalus bubalis TaxID=89462 RepID=UPI001E1B7088|nr:double homeobox protein 4C isoform X3 [Bubalus bubalis]